MQYMKMQTKGRKGQTGLSLAIPLILTLVVIGILLMVWGLIGQNLQSQTTANSSAYNVTVDTLNAVEDASGWQPTLVVVGFAVVVLGLVSMFFAFGRGVSR